VCIEDCVDAELQKEGIKTETAGTFDPQSGIKVKPRSGRCGPIAEHETRVHEGKHQADYEDMVKKYGSAYAEAYRRSAKGRVAREQAAYSEGASFLAEVLAELGRVCQCSSCPSQPTTAPTGG